MAILVSNVSKLKKIHYSVVDKVYIAQLMMVYNDIKNILKKKIFFRPTDPVWKLFIETGNKQLFFFQPKVTIFLDQFVYRLCPMNIEPGIEWIQRGGWSTTLCWDHFFY